MSCEIHMCPPDDENDDCNPLVLGIKSLGVTLLLFLGMAIYVTPFALFFGGLFWVLTRLGCVVA
jgi:hypothetical protein